MTEAKRKLWQNFWETLCHYPYAKTNIAYRALSYRICQKQWKALRYRLGDEIKNHIFWEIPFKN